MGRFDVQGSLLPRHQRQRKRFSPRSRALRRRAALRIVGGRGDPGLGHFQAERAGSAAGAGLASRSRLLLSRPPRRPRRSPNSSRRVPRQPSLGLAHGCGCIGLRKHARPSRRKPHESRQRGHVLLANFGEEPLRQTQVLDGRCHGVAVCFAVFAACGGELYVVARFVANHVQQGPARLLRRRRLQGQGLGRFSARLLRKCVCRRQAAHDSKRRGGFRLSMSPEARLGARGR
mmetsp:Transcript_15634/g.52675  ORF Transcript_15634/g.52675 Transcript_15634/m.52675 type:complete len:232 (-) Transcript_15634:1153-1848(-)